MTPSISWCSYSSLGSTSRLNSTLRRCNRVGLTSSSPESARSKSCCPAPRARIEGAGSGSCGWSTCSITAPGSDAARKEQGAHPALLLVGARGPHDRTHPPQSIFKRSELRDALRRERARHQLRKGNLLPADQFEQLVAGDCTEVHSAGLELTHVEQLVSGGQIDQLVFPALDCSFDHRTPAGIVGIAGYRRWRSRPVRRQSDGSRAVIAVLGTLALLPRYEEAEAGKIHEKDNACAQVTNGSVETRRHLDLAVLGR